MPIHLAAKGKSAFFLIQSGTAVEKNDIQINIFFISPRKHTLWLLIRSTSARRF